MKLAPIDGEGDSRSSNLAAFEPFEPTRSTDVTPHVPLFRIELAPLIHILAPIGRSIAILLVTKQTDHTNTAVSSFKRSHCACAIVCFSLEFE